MKLRLFPRQEDAYFGLFQAAADTSAATTLVDLLTDLADPESKAKQLAELIGRPMGPQVPGWPRCDSSRRAQAVAWW